MIRHVLSAVFDPASIVVVSELPLPDVVDTAHAARISVRHARIDATGAINLPAASEADQGRPDLAFVAMSTDRTEAALAALEPAPPRALLLCDMPASRAAAERYRDWAIAHDCALIGPHSFGLQRPHLGLNASLHPSLARAGRIALVTQSRTIMAAVMDWADDTLIAFSTIISLGDTGTVTLPQVVDFLATDRNTDSIAIYLDHVEDAPEFMSALRSAASAKPVIVIKTGVADQTTDTRMAHDIVVDAALRRAGALRVHYFVQLFSTIKVLSQLNRPKGRRLALFSNGSGPARLAEDAMARLRFVTKAALSEETRTALAHELSPAAQVNNPVVEPAALGSPAFTNSVKYLMADKGVDAVLTVLAPDPESELTEITTELSRLAPQSRKPLIICLMGDASMRRLRGRLAAAGVASFRTPETAADAFSQLARFHYNQQLLLQTQPPEALAAAPDLDAAHALIAAARKAQRRTLSAEEWAALLALFGIAHRDTIEESSSLPPAAIQVVRDAVMGPVIHLDAADAWSPPTSSGIELVPLNGYLARRLIERSPLWQRALRHHATPVALDKLEDLLIAASDIATVLPDVEEIHLGPVVLTDSEVIVGRAQLVLTEHPNRTPGFGHLAIAPYPRRWVRHLMFEDESPWTLRPIRPEDAEPLQDFIRELSEHTRYMRFISALRELPPRMLARYTQIDYHRELALVATVQQPDPRHRNHPREVIIGLAHYLRNADGVGAEYALVIADLWQRRGLGPILMQALISAARDQGLQYIEGVVLGTNRPMIKLMTRLDFHNEPYPDDNTMRRVWLDLTRTPREAG